MTETEATGAFGRRDATPVGAAQAPAFAVTTPASTVGLDKNRQAAVSFTVTNSSGRALRGQALIVSVAPPAAMPWLKVEGEPTHDFQVGATQQYVIRIAVPADAPPGRYTFRLAERGVANPDEEYAQSADVAFEVPAPPPPPTEKKPFPWWIVAVAVAVVVVIGGIVAFLLLRNVSVPNVVGQTLPNAQATVQAASLKVGNTTDQFSGQPAQTVINQNPAGGTSAARNSTVDLVVARGLSAADFVATWVNDDPRTRGITRLIITNPSGSTLSVHGFGACSPTDCDWGSRQDTFTPPSFHIFFDFGGGLTEDLTMTLNSDASKLTVVDRGSRSGVNTYTFHR